jgi:hypothetical protein
MTIFPPKNIYIFLNLPPKMSEQNYLETIDNMSKEKLFNFLTEKRLIYDGSQCEHCRRDMHSKMFLQSEVGYNWRCMNSACSYYLTSLSALHCSFFHNSCIGVKKIIKTIYYLCKKTKHSHIAEYVSISRNTVVKIKKN